MKKILVTIAAALLTVFMSGITVSAAQLSSVDIERLVNSTNKSIEQEITKAQNRANILTNKYVLVTSGRKMAQELVPANSKAYNRIAAQLQDARSLYEAEMDKLINELVQTTNNIANETIRIAGDNGITVICELVKVQIGNRVVLIDPLRVADT